MAAEGEAGPKLARLLYFVGAGVLFTAAINKWRDIERKSIEKQMKSDQLLLEKQSSLVHKPTTLD